MITKASQSFHIKFKSTDAFYIAIFGLIPFQVLQHAPSAFPLYGFCLAGLMLLLSKHQITISLIAFVTLNTTSNWYSLNENNLTLYDVDVVGFKLAELITYASIAKVLYLNKWQLGLQMRSWVGLWLVAIILSFLTARIQGVTFRDSFIFSEFRGLLAGLGLLLIFPSIIANKASVYISSLVVFACYKILLTLPEYFFEIPILWNSVAPNYSSNNTAFFGSENDLLMPIIIICYCLSAISYAKNPRVKTLYILLFLAYLVIFLSMKRSIVIASLSLFLYHIFKDELKKGMVALVVIITSLTCIYIAASLFVPKEKSMGIVYRILGTDQRVDMSNKGRILDVIDGINSVYSSPIFGSGVGARIHLSRSYLFGENIEYLIIHQGTLHMWIKYGIYGVVIYYLMFYQLIRSSKCQLNQNSSAHCEIKSTISFVFLLGIALLIIEQFNAAFFQNYRKIFIIFLILYISENSARRLISAETEGIEAK